MANLAFFFIYVGDGFVDVRDIFRVDHVERMEVVTIKELIDRAINHFARITNNCYNRHYRSLLKNDVIV